MQNVATSGTSLFGLIGHFRDEVKSLIRNEIQLAKTEISEKLAKFGRNAVALAIGGVSAFAGLIMLLAGLSSLLSYAFESLGMSRSLAFFLGALIIGLLAALTGFILITKAAKTFSQESVAPEKTLDTLKQMKPGTHEAAAATDYTPAEPKRSSDEIKATVTSTQQEIGETAEEISQRLKPAYMGYVIKEKIKEHPVRSSVIGAGTGLLGFLVIWRRWRHARA